MKALAKTQSDHLSDVAQHLYPDSIDRRIDIPCEASVLMRTAVVNMRSPWDDSFPGRPYLSLGGECKKISGSLPAGVHEIVFDADSGIAVDFLYEFSDDELKTMIDNGLFRRGFKCPDIFFNNDFELPITCNFTTVMPENEDDMPVIFVDVVDARAIPLSADTCGYVLGTYFEPVVEDSYDLLNENEYDVEHTVDPTSLFDVETKEPTIEVDFDDDPDYDEEHQELVDEYSEIYNRIRQKHLETEPISPNSESKGLDDDILSDDDTSVTSPSDKPLESISEPRFEDESEKPFVRTIPSAMEAIVEQDNEKDDMEDGFVN